MLDEIKKIIKYNKYALIVLLILVSVTYFAWSFVSGVIFKQISGDFDILNERITFRIEDNINDFENVLLGLRGLYEASDFVSRDEFSEFIDAQNIFERYPALHSVQFVEIVDLENIDEYILDRKEEGFDDFKVSGKGEFDQLYVVNYSEPKETFYSVFGNNLAIQPSLKEVFEKTRDINGFVISSPSFVGVYSVDVPVIFAVLPIYQNRQDLSNLQSRRESIFGYVVITLKTDDIIKNAFDNSIDETLVDYKITDGQKEVIDRIYNINPNNDLFFSRGIELGGRKWFYRSYATDEFFDQYNSEFTLTTFSSILGLFISILVSFVVFIVTNTSRKTTIVIEKMKKDYERQKDKLEEQTKLFEKEKKEAEDRLLETEKLNKVMIGREIRMKELKDELKKIKNNEKRL